MTIATRPVDGEPVEDHAGPAGRVPPVPVQARSGPAGHQGHVEVGEQAGLGPADVGDGVDAVHGGGHDAGIADEARLDRLGVQLLEGGEAAGIAGDLDLEALAVGPEGPGRVEVLLPHQPVDRGRDHRLAVDRGLPGEPLRRHRPRLDRADGRVDGRGGHRHLVGGPQLGLDVEAHLVGDHEDRLAEPAAERVDHDAGAGLLGGLAEQHPVAHHVGRAVGADVGELLRPHVGDRARQGRDHEREPLGDPPGVDPGAVQGHAGLLGDGVELLALLGRRVEPAERGDHVLARLEDGGHHRRVGEDRAVEDAVGLGGQQGVDVAGGGHAQVLAAQERAEVDALLGRAVDPGPGQLELGMRQDPLHGGTAHAAGGPLDHAKAHGRRPLLVGNGIRRE